MDIEIASMLNRKSILNPFDQPNNIEDLKVGSIIKKNGVLLTRHRRIK